MLAPEPIIDIKGEDGLILGFLEELRVCATTLHKLAELCLPKAHLGQLNLQWSQMQRGLAQSDYYLHISEFGGNLNVKKIELRGDWRPVLSLLCNQKNKLNVCFEVYPLLLITENILSHVRFI